MAAFEKFGDETEINSPAKSIGKVVFIIRQYPAEIVTTPIFRPWENYGFSGISFLMAVFIKFSDETDIDLPAESIGKVILIVRQYPAEVRLTPIFDRVKFGIFMNIISNGRFWKVWWRNLHKFTSWIDWKGYFIIQHYNNTLQRYGPSATLIFDHGKIVDFHKYHFKKPFLTGLVTKLA